MACAKHIVRTAKASRTQATSGLDEDRKQRFRDLLGTTISGGLGAYMGLRTGRAIFRNTVRNGPPGIATPTMARNLKIGGAVMGGLAGIRLARRYQQRRDDKKLRRMVLDYLRKHGSQ